MTLSFEAVEELCKVSSVTEALAGDSRYPEWINDIEKFSAFQEAYVSHVEQGRTTNVDPAVIDNCEKQLAILEDLLMEKKQINEEASRKKNSKKKGKK